MEINERDQTRNVFKDLIDLISDFERQLKYQINVPIADVPAELICQWFDDHYYPETEWFAESFNETEREILKEFNDYYEARLKQLPNTTDIHVLQTSQIWIEISEKAKLTLEGIKW